MSGVKGHDDGGVAAYASLLGYRYKLAGYRR